MAEPDLGIDEASEPLKELPLEERRLFTQSFDLAVQTVLEQWEDQTLILPEVQREYVWTDRHASALVESLLLGIPIPLLYFAETEDARWEIFDGHQRVFSVVRFVNGMFSLRGLTVLTHLNGHSWDDLSAQEQRQLLRRMLRAVIITADSHPDMKFEIFERLNTGAIVLRPQEVRNSLFRGPFNDLLHDVVHDENFRSCVGTKEPRRRMVDQELALRFFAFRDELPEYQPPLKYFLNHYMAARKDSPPAMLEELRITFTRTTQRVAAALGPVAFRQFGPSSRRVERSPNRALFDAQMLAFSWTRDNNLIDSTQIEEEIGRLFDDAEFVRSIGLATGDRTRTFYRVEMMCKALEAAGLDLEGPAL